MKKLLLAIALLLPQAVFADAKIQDSDCVILLHGVMRDAGSMFFLERDLKNHGFFVVNDGYPSTSASVEELAKSHIPQAIAKCPEGSTVNFVTHSMGGILVRAFYANPANVRPNRVVMLAPPNHGSEIIDDELFAVFGGISGESGAELGTSPQSLPNRLGAVDYPVGIVAGNFSINPIFSDVIPSDDDGAVSVGSTHVEGENDWILIKASHSFIMNNSVARRHVIEFLQNGHFTH